MGRLRKKAEESQAGTAAAEDSKERAQLFADRYVNFLNELSVRPSGRGILTVRSILEAQQHILREFGFPDAFCVQKKVIHCCCNNQPLELTVHDNDTPVSVLSWRTHGPSLTSPP